MRGKRISPAPWISVEERLPEKEVPVLVVCSSSYDGGQSVLVAERKWTGHWTLYEGAKITHWMPLPALPNGGRENAKN